MCFYPKSSRLLAVEGTLNRTADAIYVFDVFGNKLAMCRSCAAHPAFQSAWILTRAEDSPQLFMPREKCTSGPQRTSSILSPPTPRHRFLKPSTDVSGKFILAREVGYGFIRVLDTKQECELRLSSMNPSHAASIASAGDWLVRFYWEQLPMNPYSTEVNAEEATERWWTAFRNQVPVCCHIEPVPPVKHGKSANMASGTQHCGWRNYHRSYRQLGSGTFVR
jgi:hypothetical protein